METKERNSEKKLGPCELHARAGSLTGTMMVDFRTRWIASATEFPGGKLDNELNFPTPGKSSDNLY